VKVKRKLLLCLLAVFFLSSQALALDEKVSATLSHYIMAVMYDDLGQADKAVEEYKKALKTGFENPAIHLNLAISYLKNNNFVKAREELSLVAKLNPEAVEPHALMALVYSLENKRELAAGEYELALKNASKLSPENVDIYRALGIIYLEQKKLDAAENIYRLILDLSPDDPEAHFYLANIYFEQKNKIAAIEELKKTLELKPDYAEALNYLGYLYVEENKNLNQAEVMIKKALEFEPDNGAYIDSLGWLYFKQGKLSEALKQLEKAAASMNDPVIQEHLNEVKKRINGV
jgi:Tfp pilus assembly protein PilF